MKYSAPLMIVLILLIMPAASAWQWETHSTLAEKVCRDFDCGCITEIREGAITPDKEFNDFINHHCYNISESCVSSKYYDCPKKNNCPALDKMQFWLDESKKASGCEKSSRECSKLSDTSCQKWKDIGIASHYYFDSRVFWHKTQGEDYNKCHEPFEGAVEKKFEANDGSNWTIDTCGTSENYSNMVRYVSEFENILADNGAPRKVADAPLLSECGWWCRLWMWLTSYF